MVDPATATLIASAISQAAQGAGNALKARREKKEAKRQTHAELLEEVLNRNAQLHGHKLSSRAKLGKRSAQNAQNTAELVRGALTI